MGESYCQVSKLFYEIIGSGGFREVWQREAQRHYPDKVHFKFMTKENDWIVASLRFATLQGNLTRVDRQPLMENLLVWAKSFIDERLNYMLEWDDENKDEVRRREGEKALHALKYFERDSEIPKENDSKVPLGI